MQIFKCLIQAIIRKNADLNPAKYPSLAKNPPKYTTAYNVQQRNCRWHCEPTFFSGWASTMKSLFTPSLFDLSLSYLSISNPSLSKPSFSSPWSVWWLKLKECLLTICFADFKRAGQKVEAFYILYRCGDFTLYFCPALLPSAREMRDIVKNDLTA